MRDLVVRRDAIKCVALRIPAELSKMIKTDFDQLRAYLNVGAFNIVIEEMINGRRMTTRKAHSPALLIQVFFTIRESEQEINETNGTLHETIRLLVF